MFDAYFLNYPNSATSFEESRIFDGDSGAPRNIVDLANSVF